ncbi:DUF1707 SHOCT-like domain-containing protein [Kutzneria albida]|uniref:DUF1707 domain-containing protein n=1 Tax=Kutzneria albida DSM 43870 TaxID=1449976 RepID=W5WJF1_9PSEU|nr:DUF1707 domain-containing protein [Kutzneria albida]AHI01329.1 hypothetical protein KALB_7971 [Kutzneria albida DSM 43870]
MDDLRVGDAERQQALADLGVHMRDGRLGIDEYGDRAARLATARTRGEVIALFTDLPDPRPEFMPVDLVRRRGFTMSRRALVPVIGLVWVAAILGGLELRLLWLIPLAIAVTLVLNAMARGNR